MEDSEATLPKSTLLKLARELLPADVKVATDTQELIVKCSNEFVQLLATQANEVSEGANKKTLTPEHVVTALQQLGFDDFVAEVEAYWQQFKEDAQGAPKISKKTKAETQGLSEAEQIAMQDRMFAEARARSGL
jgi:histone H3/H4